ncbi:hypothetical protein HanRHA438_Chr02g0057921 [Helianthus annuus]|nr:hypothetical protein HanRHA438_Chr02g0057921 [Helianthus annuus]
MAGNGPEKVKSHPMNELHQNDNGRTVADARSVRCRRPYLGRRLKLLPTELSADGRFTEAVADGLLGRRRRHA